MSIAADAFKTASVSSCSTIIRISAEVLDAAMLQQLPPRFKCLCLDRALICRYA
jgi:hypothetical protein